MIVKKLRYLYLFALLVAAPDLIAQTITGTVTDATDGELLPGVNVTVVGTLVGVATLADGTYSITVPADAEFLRFSYLGYETRSVPISGRSVINIELVPDTRVLDDVVVTALGLEADQRTLGYSIQSIRGQNITDTRQTSVSDAISGQFAGVQVTSQAGVPGGATSVNIRGRSSLLGNNEPLYIVDGVPISNQYNTTVTTSSVDASNRAIDLNSADIESITILKGPAAAALYGIDAANGAIVIQTKSGNRGTIPRTSIQLNSRFGVTQVNRYNELQRLYGPGTNGNLGVTNVAHWGPALDNLTYDGVPSNWHINGTPIVKTDPSQPSVEVYDNFDAFFEDGLSLSNSVSISTGTRDRNFFFSFGRDNEGSFVPKTEFERTSLRLNSDARLNDQFRISARANYINSGGRRAGRGNNFTSVMIPLTRTNPAMDITFGTSDPKNDPFAYINPDDGSARTSLGVSQAELGRDLYGAGRGADSPFWSVNNNVFRDEVNRFLGNSTLFYDMMPGVELSYRLGVDAYSDRRRHNFELGSSGGDGVRGRLFEENYTTRNIASDFMVNVRRNLSEDLTMDLIAGHNYQSDVTHRLYISGRGFDQPGFFNMANTTEPPLIQHGTTQRERVAVYSNVNFGFRDYLYLSLTGRNEWSSTLPTDNNNFFYPAVSLAFVLTDAFDIATQNFNFAQFRLSYATVGNDAPIYGTNSYFVRTAPGMSYGNSFQFPFNNVIGANASTIIGNPDIKPEKNTTIEVGTDLRFLDNRVRLDMTYYYSSNKDQIINATLPSSSGFLSYLTNIGEMENKGIEVQLTASPVMNRDFRWDINVNFSRNRNEVISLAEGVDLIELGGLGPVGTGINPRLVPGQPFGVFYGVGYLRDDSGNIVISSSNPADTRYGYPMRTEGVVKLGDPNPDFTVGIRNSLNYRMFRLTSLIDIRKGGDIWDGTQAVMVQNGQARVTENRGEAVVFPGVKQDGTPNDIEVTYNQFYYSSVIGYNHINEPFVQDASWVRLRDVTLSYTLSSRAVTQFGLQSATFSVWGRNLLLFTGVDGIDPETNLYGPNNSMGVIYYNNPGARSFGFEVSLAL